MSIDVVHFNPMRRRSGPLGRVLPKRPLNNFGDLIGPILVAQIADHLNLREPSDTRRLVTVGSIMKLTRPGDVVWGTGINGKSMNTGGAPDLDVRAVRGPRTRDLLVQSGTTVPEVFGDPGLLWSYFWPLDRYRNENAEQNLHDVTVVPNFHDRHRMRGGYVVDPLQDPFDVIREIALSSFVCGSSLHGIVLAESFGVPARLVKPGAEPAFKYDDYYAGTGRESYEVAKSVQEAIDMGGERAPDFDPRKLLDAFPRDIYIQA